MILVDSSVWVDHLRVGRRALQHLPSATVATSEEALVFIDRHGLAGTGVGYVDVQLLAAAQLTPDTRFWTTDKRLAATAARLGLAVDPVALNDGP